MPPARPHDLNLHRRASLAAVWAGGSALGSDGGERAGPAPGYIYARPAHSHHSHHSQRSQRSLISQSGERYMEVRWPRDADKECSLCARPRVSSLPCR
jgi:hypothetical protein